MAWRRRRAPSRSPPETARTSCASGTKPAWGAALPLPGDGNVYLVDADLLEDFSLGLYDIVSMESIPSMTDLTSVSIETTSGTLTLDYLEDSGLAYSNQYTWFWNQDGGRDPPGHRPGRRSGLHRHRPDLERLRGLPG